MHIRRSNSNVFIPTTNQSLNSISPIPPVQPGKQRSNSVVNYDTVAINTDINNTDTENIDTTNMQNTNESIKLNRSQRINRQTLDINIDGVPSNTQLAVQDSITPILTTMQSKALNDSSRIHSQRATATNELLVKSRDTILKLQSELEHEKRDKVAVMSELTESKRSETSESSKIHSIQMTHMQQLNELQQQLDKLKTENQQLQVLASERDVIEDKVIDLEGGVRELNGRVTELTTQLNASHARVQILERENASLLTIQTEQYNHIDTLESTIQRISKEYDALKLQQQDTHTMTEAEYNTIKSELETAANTQVEALKTKFEAKIEQQKNLINSQQKQLEALSIATSQKIKELDTVRKENTKLTTHLHDVTESMSNEWNKQLDLYTRDWNDKLSLCEKRIEQMTVNETKLNEFVVDSKVKHVETTAQIQAHIKENENLQQKLTELQAHIQQKEAEFEQYRIEQKNQILLEIENLHTKFNETVVAMQLERQLAASPVHIAHLDTTSTERTTVHNQSNNQQLLLQQQQQAVNSEEMERIIAKHLAAFSNFTAQTNTKLTTLIDEPVTDKLNTGDNNSTTPSPDRKHSDSENDRPTETRTELIEVSTLKTVTDALQHAIQARYLSQHTAELHSQQIQYEAEITQLQQQIQNLKNLTNTDIQYQIETLNTQLQQMQQLYHTEAAQSELLKQTHTENQQKIKSYEHTIDKLKKQLSDQLEKFTQIERTTATTTVTPDVQAKLNKYKQKITADTELITKLQHKIQLLKTALVQYKSQLKQQNVDTTETKVIFEQLKHEMQLRQQAENEANKYTLLYRNTVINQISQGMTVNEKAKLSELIDHATSLNSPKNSTMNITEQKFDYTQCVG